MLQYGRSYEGVTVTTMGKRELFRVLLDVFPRKLACDPSSASEIVAELRAFWSFLRREFGLPNADECLAVLDEKMAWTLERELDNPMNFGLAKSLVMGGTAAGFDMSTEEGIGAFMDAYNANPQAVGVGPALAPRRLRPTPAEKNKKKAQRRAKRESRRKNRGRREAPLMRSVRIGRARDEAAAKVWSALVDVRRPSTRLRGGGVRQARAGPSHSVDPSVYRSER